MQTLTAQPDLLAYPIGPRQSSRVVEQAIRARARVMLEPRAVVDGPLTGSIVTAAPESLCVALVDGHASAPHTLTSVHCDATLLLHGDRYVFATNIMAVIDAGAPIRLEIARPESLSVVQRRRFWRAAVHGSSQVTVLGTGDSRSWRADGVLLNASLDGLACRIPAEDAAGTPVGDRLRVRFALPGCPESFDLTAIVRAKHPAGTEGFMILGVQFCSDEQLDTQRDQLRCALTHGQDGHERSDASG